ncbi:MAG: hypothetical protein K2X35_02395 [Bryobacteraceae bacterium]|nr:hypothetical protein [Bryobacteraceae bacterium]
MRVREKESAPAEDTLEAIRQLIAESREPALVEPGEDPIRLRTGHYQIEMRGGMVILEAWEGDRNLLRRVSGIVSRRKGRLDLQVERFGRKPGLAAVLDWAWPGNHDAALRTQRLKALEAFRVLLRRQFPGWALREITAGKDLEHSLSDAYPRALLLRGKAALAAICAPAGASNVDGVLSIGLIWLEHVRKREPHLPVEGLLVAVPRERSRNTCLRARFLAGTRLWIMGVCDGGSSEMLDAADVGNLDTAIEPARRTVSGREPEIPMEGVERRENRDGSVSLLVRGLEFARDSGSGFEYGIDGERTRSASAGALLAAELRRVRGQPGERRHPLHSRHPEAWLESQVRAHLEEIDADLLPEPVYGQVPALAGGDRGVIDLLAAGRDGRAAVIELKATSDLHLPLQALDYWMRVRWHLEADDFRRNGYFPGVVLNRLPPRLLLVCPALEFHPTTSTILRYFSPEVPVERYGLGVEWQKTLKVVMRRER